MSAFLMIIFVSFTILTVIISSMTIQAANEQKKDDAQQNMALLKTYIDDMWRNTFPHNSFEQFVKQNNTEIATMINILSRKSDEMNVFITTPDGKILVSTDGIYSGKRISDGDVLSALLFIHSFTAIWADSWKRSTECLLLLSITETAHMMGRLSFAMVRESLICSPKVR